MSVIEIIGQGGCYWKRERYESPGHSIAIPNGTPFRITIDGPGSHKFVVGKCYDGYFAVESGAYQGQKFHSANDAVNTVREPQSNAFLYTQFQIGGQWIGANEYRRSEASRLDQAEENALRDALEKVRMHPTGKTLDGARALRLAANLVAKNPSMIENARRDLEFLAKLPPLDFDEDDL